MELVYLPTFIDDVYDKVRAIIRIPINQRSLFLLYDIISRRVFVFCICRFAQLKPQTRLQLINDKQTRINLELFGDIPSRSLTARP